MTDGERKAVAAQVRRGIEFVENYGSQGLPSPISSEDQKTLLQKLRDRFRQGQKLNKDAASRVDIETKIPKYEEPEE